MDACRGTDTAGSTYSSRKEMWDRELPGGDSKEWYAKAGETQCPISAAVLRGRCSRCLSSRRACAAPRGACA